MTSRRSPTRPAESTESLRAALSESREALRAIRAGEVDALVVTTTEGDQLFTLTGADKPYRLFFDSMAEGALTVLTNGTILWVNARMLELTKTTADQLVGSKIEHLFKGDSHTLLRAMLRSKASMVTPLELTMRTGDDGDVAVALTASPLNLDGLNVTCVLVTDITEQRRALESEHFHAELLAAAGEAIVVTDAEGHITFVNRAAELQYGWNTEEVFGRLIADTLPSKYAGEDASWVLDDAKAGRTWSGEFSVQHRSGDWIDVYGTVTPVFGDDGVLVALIGITADITERKEAETARDASEQWFRSLIQHSSDMIVVVDAMAVIRYVSSSGYAVLGYEDDELIGKNMPSFVHPEDLPILAEATLAVTVLPLGTAAPLALLRIRNASGEWRWLETVGTNLLHDSAVEGVVINCRDVTEKVHLSRALQTLSQANKVLVRADTESVLLSDICNTIVDSGYALAWVGFVDSIDAIDVATVGVGAATPDVQRVVRVGAAAGQVSFLPRMEFAWGGDEYWSEAVATTLETGTTQIINEMHAVTFDTPWRTRADAWGFRSACVLPMQVGAYVIGAMCIYSLTPDSFDAQSVELLGELTANLAYGIDRLRERGVLAEREALLREAERLAHAGHWRWSPARDHFEFLADEIFEIYGIARDQWPGTTEALLSFVPRDERQDVSAALARSAAGEAVEWHNTLVRPNGELRRIRTRTSIRRHDDGQIEAVLGACVDYTESAAGRKRLIFQAQLLDNAGQAIVAADNFGVVTYWNLAAEAMFGWSVDEALGRAITDVMPIVDFIDQFEDLLAVSERGGFWRGDLTVLHRDGTLVQISATDTPSHDGAGSPNGVIRVASDVSERRALELRLNQAQRLESLGLLAGGIAHDFNNLLTVILNYGSMIERGVDENASQQARKIVAAGESAARLIRQLLTFARREPIHVEKIDVNEVVLATQELLARTIGEHITMEVRSGQQAAVLIDRGQLEQVVVNLAVNACDAMPDGGLLTIETSVVELDEGFAKRHPGVIPRTYAQIVVSDTGRGMSPDVLAHAFDPFYTTRNFEGGTGLGLSTVHGIAKVAGGDVYLYSESGVGTSVRVYLPLCENDDATRRIVEKNTPTLREGTKVLVVENQDTVRVIACDLIRKRGCTVIEAATPADALKVAAEQRFDLILTDVILPDMSGPTLVKLLESTYGALPVVYMSGYSADFLGNHGDLDPDVILVQKPFTEAALLNAVGVALDAAVSKDGDEKEVGANLIS